MLYQPVFQLFQVVLVAQATLSLPEKTFKNTENKLLMGITLSTTNNSDKLPLVHTLP